MTTTIASLRADVVLNTAKAKKEAGEFTGDLRKLRTTLRQLESTEEKQERQLEQLKEALAADVIGVKQFEEAERRLKGTLQKTNVQLDKQKTQLVGLRRAGGDMAMGLAGRLPGGGMAGQLAATGSAGAAVGGAAIGAGAAVGTVAALTKVTIAQSEYVNTLNDTALKIGTTAGALRGLQEAGQLTGVSAEATAMGLQRLRRRISEAANGIGDARAAFKELGLNAEALALLRPEEQFLQVAEAMKRLGNSGDQMRLSIKLVDSEAAGLVNTFRMNQEELKGMVKRFDELIDPQTTADAAALQMELTKLNTEMQALAVIIAKELMPAVSGVLNVINAAARGEERNATGEAFAGSLRNTLTGGALLGRSGLEGINTDIAAPVEEQEAFKRQLEAERQASRTAGSERAGGLLGNAVADAVKAASGGLASAAGRLDLEAVTEPLREVIRGEIQLRKDSLRELEAENRKEIAAQKRFNQQLERNLLAPDLKPGDSARLEVEQIARQRFGVQAFDVKANEEMLAESQNKLRAAIDKLTAQLANPAPAAATLPSIRDVGESLGDIVGELF